MAVPRRVFMRQMRFRDLLCILIPMAEQTENQSNHGAQADMRLPKSERLRHRAAVLRLFDKGRSEYAYPLRMIALAMPRSEAAGMFNLRRLFAGANVFLHGAHDVGLAGARLLPWQPRGHGAFAAFAYGSRHGHQSKILH